MSCRVEEMEGRWAAVNEDLSDTQREKVRLLLAAAQFANLAYHTVEDKDSRQAPITSRHLAGQYFCVVEELQRIAETTSERATVMHMEKISRFLVERGWQGLPSTAKAVHEEMKRLRNHKPATSEQEEERL